MPLIQADCSFRIKVIQLGTVHLSKIKAVRAVRWLSSFLVRRQYFSVKGERGRGRGKRERKTFNPNPVTFTQNPIPS
jgi:hypothetical protein